MLISGRHISKLSGYAPALPTPFDDEGNVDVPAFERLCDLQLANGATALVVCGTTGEAPTLSPAEHRELIRIAVAQARGRIPVIAGAGANATEHAIELTRDAEATGADAALSVVPYYNKPTQSGLYAHFRAIAQSTGLPIILYDVPSRTACGLADETVARLAELPRIIGLKDAAGDASRPARLRPLVGTKFRLLCGDDGLAGAGWRRLYFGDLKCCPRPLPQHVLGLETWTIRSCSAPRPPCRRADCGALPRDQSCSGKACPSAARPYVANRPFAIGRLKRSSSGGTE